MKILLFDHPETRKNNNIENCSYWKFIFIETGSTADDTNIWVIQWMSENDTSWFTRSYK